ncbi:hypothetical protein tb265_48040 [Gemmatimonadetes bacterium T265]|nr:hypothetical protein tb265_48040 [Gemmatimonadetes bacterium T265]
MLSTIAGSMITVSGVTFSITIAAVAQASAQYTPRVLRTFMGDRANHAVLGAYIGIFAYCLIVLRTIRGGSEGVFVPAAAALGGFLFALTGAGVLVYFIVHISESLQTASILDRVRRETDAAVDRLVPEPLGAAEVGALAGAAWRPVAGGCPGYVQAVDDGRRLAFARERGAVVRMLAGVGDFAVAGAPLAAVTGRDRGGGGLEQLDELADCYAVRPYRVVAQDAAFGAQDAAFGVQQLVDVALKALSPGVNDTTTAVTCVDHLTAVLARVAARHMPDLV